MYLHVKGFSADNLFCILHLLLELLLLQAFQLPVCSHYFYLLYALTIFIYYFYFTFRFHWIFKNFKNITISEKTTDSDTSYIKSTTMEFYYKIKHLA